METLLKKIDSRYTLVIASSKRARQLTAGAKILTHAEAHNDVSISINEIAEGKVTYYKLYKNEAE